MEPVRKIDALIEASERPGGFNHMVLGTLAAALAGMGAYSEARDVLAEAVSVASTSAELMALAVDAWRVGEPWLTLELAARAGGENLESGSDLLDFGARLLSMEIPGVLHQAIMSSMAAIKEAEASVRAPAEEVDAQVGDHALRVFEEFTPLRQLANEFLGQPMAHMPSSD